jgi:beta-lactam-binding protein with PASTA domain
VGLKEADAKTKITAAGCAPGKTTRKYSTRRPKGRVLSQNPGADFIEDTGTRVNLTVSKGKKPKPKHKPKHRPKHKPKHHHSRHHR